MNKKLTSIALLSALSALSSAAFAEDAAPAAAAAPTPNWTFPGSVSVANDYIWRGQTQTWGKPAASFGIEADHVSGFYAGYWASNVSDRWLPGANVEMDFYAGIRNSFATDFKYDVGAIYVYYPGANFNKAAAFQAAPGPYNDSDLNTLEAYASLGWKWFSVKAGTTLTEFYGWNANNSGTAAAGGANLPSFAGDASAGVDKNGSTRYSSYLQGNVSYDLPMGFNIAGEIGHEFIADSTNLDWTWYKATVTKSFDGGWSVSGAVSGTSGTSAYHNFVSFEKTSDTQSIDDTKFVVTLTKGF